MGARQQCAAKLGPGFEGYMTQILDRTILFADLRGSTALYEKLGNAEASRIVTQSVSLMTQIVGLCEGVVVKTLGDGLLAMFESPTAALAASDEMHASVGADARPSFSTTAATAADGSALMKLQIGMAHGQVVEINGDCFGDAVNVAARLLDHAGDNETLVTATVMAGLDERTRGRFRSLDRLQLRGRVEPVPVHVLEAKRFRDTAPTVFEEELSANVQYGGIRLMWLTLNELYAGPMLPLVIGRSPQVDFCVDDSRVSRSHARLDWQGGAFSLTDLSFNGTWVRFRGETEIVALRRSSCTLHGSGVIGLGSQPNDITAANVRFEIVRFATTTPQAAWIET
jgi:adenylate cyclase